MFAYKKLVHQNLGKHNKNVFRNHDRARSRPSGGATGKQGQNVEEGHRVSWNGCIGCGGEKGGGGGGGGGEGTQKREKLGGGLHYTRLFPDPRFLLFVLQNIAGKKNVVECLLQ